MGCVQAKCCTSCAQFPKFSDDEKGDVKKSGPNTEQKGNLGLNGLSDSVLVPSHGYVLEYSVFTQKGLYPDTPDKENQDSFCIKTRIQGNPNVHFFGVFDGHGQFGYECSNFVKDRLVDILSNDPALLDDPVKAYNSAFLTTNEELHKSDIDDSMSGTTAITVLVIGDCIYVANVGDSRAVLAVKEENRIFSDDLSLDQTPFRKDECERVKMCGARVLSVDQVEGIKDPNIQNWGDEETEGGDPPRLWVPDGMFPGTAFTRSVGDSTAESIGVMAEPEVTMVQLTPDNPFFVVASDGVFEFLPSQTVVDMVTRYKDPKEACTAIVGESYKLWLENENRTDDITIIIVHVKNLSNSDTCGRGEVKMARSNLTIGKPDMCVTHPRAEDFCSPITEFSDLLEPSQKIVSSDRNLALVAPSPTRTKLLLYGYITRIYLWLLVELGGGLLGALMQLIWIFEVEKKLGASNSELPSFFPDQNQKSFSINRSTNCSPTFNRKMQ